MSDEVKIYHLILIESKDMIGMEEIVRRINTALEGNLIELKPVPTEKLVRLVSKYDINFREQANSGGKLIPNGIKKSETMTLLEKTNSTYWKVNYNGKIGYVSSTHVEEIK